MVNGNLEEQGWHANQSVWAFSGSPCSYWVEEGVTQGYHGQVEYTWYGGYNNSSGYNDFPAGTTTPDGTNHIYNLAYSGRGIYEINRDQSTITTVSGLGAGTCISEAGLELSTDTALSNYQTATFDLNPLSWVDSSNTLHTGWNKSQYWIDDPCGAGFTSPNCLNGIFTTGSRWSDNRG